jgi:hypothetical protein
MRQWLGFSGATGPVLLKVNENFARCAWFYPVKAFLFCFT